MEKTRSQIGRTGLPGWTVPTSLLLFLVLAFGLLIPFIGYYHDDWHFIFYHAMRGTQGLVDLFIFDGHPLAAWSYILSFKLLGYWPIAWHIYGLVWRWVAVVTFWACLQLIWPQHRGFNFTVALLFAIHPIFTLQYLPISYFEVWVSFSFLWLSFYFSIQAVKRPKHFWLFMTLALLVKLGHMFTSEYTWGTEIMRLVFIWLALPAELTVWKKIKRTGIVSLSFILIAAAFTFWRSAIYHSARNAIGIQPEIVLANPLGAGLAILRNLTPDLILTLFAAWNPVVNPLHWDFSKGLNLIFLSTAFFSGIITWFYLQKLDIPTTDPGTANPYQPALVLGFVGMIFGLIPGYIAGYSVYLSSPPGNVRFALGAMPGAALILSALVHLLAGSQRSRIAIFAVLVGLSVGWHNHYTNDLRIIWKAQKDFYQQLLWRAPGIKPNTAIVAPNNIFPLIEYAPAILAVRGNYPTSMLLNTIYNMEPDADGRIALSFVQDLEKMLPPGQALSPDLPLVSQHLDSYAASTLKNSLVVFYIPQKRACLHLVRPADANFRHWPPLVKELAPLTSLESVELNTGNDRRIFKQIFGDINKNSWCYFYQKADLASQFQDWNTVNRLWKEANQKGFQPSNGIEYIPFIEAALQTGDWKKAFELTRRAKLIDRQSIDIACMLWKQVNETNLSQEQLTELTDARGKLRCSRP